MTKYEKWEIWDEILGWTYRSFIYKPWPEKDHARYYLKNCPSVQISDPDLPF